MDYFRLLNVLSDAGVEFVVIGGVAGILHGASRFTQDCDVVYERSADNLLRLVQALAPYHPYLRGVPPGLPFKWDVKTLQAGLNFTLTTDIGAIDLLGHVTGGPAFHDLLPDRTMLGFDERQWPCVSLDRLIGLKRAAGRPKDFEAIAELEALREEGR